MMPILAQAESVFLLSFVKPVIVLLLLLGWARLFAMVDQDLDYYLLPKWMWHPGLMGVALLAFWLLLITPFFILGLLVAIILLGGGFVAYATFRNPRVPEPARWRISIDRLRGMVGQIQYAQVQKRATVAFIAADSTRKDVPAPNTPLGEAHAKLEELIDFALPRGADRIDLVVSAQKARASVMVDGFSYEQPDLPPKAAMTLVNYLKTNARMDTEDLRKKQQGDVTIESVDKGRHVLALVTQGSPTELRLTAHIDPAKLSARGLDQLGLLSAQRQVLEPVMGQVGGLVLISAPPSEGLTTTLYCMLHLHDPYLHNVTTLEDEIAYQVEGVEHQVVEPGTENAQLARRVTATLRRSPQVLLIGRPLSPEVAKALVHEARSVRVYAGVQQPDAFGALAAMVKMIGEPQTAAAAMTAVIAQRLARTLCKTCRQAYRPDAEALRKLNLPPERVGQLYKASGKVTVNNRQIVCPDCAGMGYRGRLAIFEVMTLDDQARVYISQGQMDQLRAYLRKQQKMIWLQEAALSKVIDGSTSIGEVNRVLTGVRPAPGGVV
ncbi:MAG: Flp pilus assembly complex ATPase component TadA [Phycisphaeraceae bacterium]|nr:Flp pilus assembly complex ATPase component TadA [Phycisphaeraceae bacterium]